MWLIINFKRFSVRFNFISTFAINQIECKKCDQKYCQLTYHVEYFSSLIQYYYYQTKSQQKLRRLQWLKLLIINLFYQAQLNIRQNFQIHYNFLHHITSVLFYNFYQFLPFIKTMLNSSVQVNKFNRINQHIMRRRARNLRAKIKALLPVQNCCKFDHRNRCVHEIESNKKTWLQLSNKKAWTFNQNKQNRYYVEEEGNMGNFQRFQKLTNAEIQQIKEDKLYYLGEANIQDFLNFLQSKAKSKDPQFGFNIITKSFENMFQNKNLLQFINRHRASEQSESFRIQKQRTQNYVQKKVSVDQKLREFGERRKLIQIEERSKNVTNKVKLNMRLERAEAKLKQLNQKKLKAFTLRKEHRQEINSKVSDRRRNGDHKGQIKCLQQQLRQTFLVKKSRTAKQMSRSVRIFKLQSSN